MAFPMAPAPAQTGQPPARCIIYVRISSDDVDPADPDADRRQKVALHLSECREYAADQGWQIAETFVDPNVSASKYSTKPRPEYSRMVAWIDADTGPAPLILLTTEMERLYRQVEELLPLIRMAERTALGRIQTTNDEAYDLSTANGRHSAIGAVNNAMRESGKLSERQTRRQRQRARDGAYQGKEPFGYTYTETGDTRNGRPVRKLAINPAEAALIREAATVVLGGASVRSVEMDWRTRGIRTRPTRRTPRGKPWEHVQIRRLLINPLYAGIRVHRPGEPGKRADSHPGKPGESYPGDWEPILTEDTHRALRGLLLRPPAPGRTREGQRSGQHWPGPVGNARVYLASGLLRCSRCGAVLTGYKHTNGTPAYRCPPAPRGCLGVHRGAAPVHDLLAAAVVYWLREGGPFAAYLARNRPAGDDTARLAELRGEEARITAEIRQVEASRRLPMDDPERRTPAEVREDKAVKEDELKAVHRDIDRVNRRRGGQQSPLQLGLTKTDWNGLTFAQQRQYLEQLVSHVVVHPTAKGRLTFDPSKVELFPASWAMGTDPTELKVPYQPARPMLREAVLAYLQEHPGEPVSPTMVHQACGLDRGHLSRAFKELADAGRVTVVQRGGGRRPWLYMLTAAQNVAA
jgi:DNA invertase Pin-like site-specific DNA recombinase